MASLGSYRIETLDESDPQAVPEVSNVLSDLYLSIVDDGAGIVENLISPGF